MRFYPLDPDLAASIRRRRRSLGLSQIQLALGAGLTESAVQRYETMRFPIPPQAREAIERALVEAERGTAVPA
jgi:transcriptional regulator with XRE-family HTH domain